MRPVIITSMRLKLAAGTVLLILVVLFTSGHAGAKPTAPKPVQIPSPYDLIAEVNALREANGLLPYQAHPILISIAQAHSEYQASIGSWTHIGPDGSRPYQRALAAGYPVAGDLSQGGWFSENVGYGHNLSVEGIVEMWRGDADHLGTMLSPVLRDVGAGVAVSGNNIFYTLDAGLSTGGTVPTNPATTSSITDIPPTGAVTVIPSTPKPDGSILHVVQHSETLWSIALAYGITIDELRLMNNLPSGAFIYPGDTLIIRRPYTPTPTQPTPTNTPRPSPTSVPTSTATQTATSLPPTPAPVPAVPRSAGLNYVLLIIALALLATGGIAWLGGRTSTAWEDS